ncbi:hypothetical protein M9Y10_007274 [Tritrichomonas musculus]|uniref:Right handed beta helix domain-containing protein n=1 Tax=Tritrichomonas musculus TaxID=1915356 RepID=A0ABR2J0W2_9EUKA
MICFFFSIAVATGDFYTWYFSPNGNMSNQGTEESPYEMNVDEINRKMKRIGSNANYRFVLMEGDYHIPGTYGLTFSKLTGNAHSVHIISQEGKRVRFIGGQKITNWTQSTLYPHLWTTTLDIQISQLFVNDKRASCSRVPKNHKKARTLYFTKYDDEKNSSYEIRKYWVQHDCINLLSKLPTDELKKARITDFHGGRWNRDSIDRIDTKNDIIYTRVLKSSIPNFGVYPIKRDDMYFIDNLFCALTNPGEWYQFPNGTLYYYPTKDDSSMNDIEAYFSDQGMGIHTAQKDNILIENIEIYYMNSHAIYNSMASNVTVRNVTVKHCMNGFSTNGQDGLIENSLFEDIGGYGGRFHSTKNVTLRNCIFRRLNRESYDQGGLYVAVNNYNLSILNNDISGSYSAPIIVSGRSSYVMDVIQNVTIKDNHIHHSGLNVMDDFGGVQGLAIPNGCIVDHNWIHDMNAAKSIGNGLFFGTGAAGVIMKNNLVHDISHDALKMDHGVNITLHNNILAYANYMMTWTRYVADTFTFHIDNNIFDSQRVYVMTGPWANEESKYYINKNIYWHQNDTSKLTWVYKTFDKWQELGNDLNSYVTDPLFVDSSKRNFNFKSKDAANKIGFKPFSMTFGVIGDEWRKNAADFKQEEPYGTPISSPVKGSYMFEDSEDECIMKMVTEFSKAQISTDKVYNGKKSLKLESTGGIKIDKDRPNVKTTLNWNEGLGEFSLVLFMEDKSWVHFGLDFDNKFVLKNGTVTFGKTEIGQFPYGKWFQLKVLAGYGENNNGTIKIAIDEKESVEVNSTYKRSTEALLEVVNSTTNVYVDNLNAKLDCKALDYFDSFASDSGNDDDDDNNNDGNNNSKNKNKKTTIIIVVVVIVVVAAVVGIVVFFILRKRKRSNVDSDMLEE